ncbi:GNAT family N-acetyltransferase [Longispora albida]|uniref:GNAT family N-acetyltransferase n=1 Tax=Longispora albida TaxID=203523 RepID=UPI00036D1B01|nr:GNAT family N-acetyltransferase [Longispora albida]
MLNDVEDYWFRVLGRDDSAGVHLVEGDEGVYVLGTPGTVRIRVQPGLLTDTLLAVHEVGLDTLLTNEFWAKVFPEGAVLGPSRHHYLKDAGQLPAYPSARRLNPGDHLALNELRAGCPEADWEESGFTEEPGALFGAFDGTRMLAAANLTLWNGQHADIGLLTRPEARGRGLGTQVAAAAASHAIRLNGVARYRALDTNQASLSIARRLGFTPYGTNLYVKLP